MYIRPDGIVIVRCITPKAPCGAVPTAFWAVLSDLELILVDDGSKDASPLTCDGYMQKMPASV